MDYWFLQNKWSLLKKEKKYLATPRRKNYYFAIYKQHKISVVTAPHNHTTSRELECGLGMFHSTFHVSGLIKWVPCFVKNKTLRVTSKYDHLNRTYAAQHKSAHGQENGVGQSRSWSLNNNIVQQSLVQFQCFNFRTWCVKSVTPTKHWFILICF